MKTEKENPPYLPKVAYVRLHTAVEVIEGVQEEKDNTDHEKVRKTVAAAKEEVFLQRRKARATKKHRKKKKR